MKKTGRVIDLEVLDHNSQVSGDYWLLAPLIRSKTATGRIVNNILLKIDAEEWNPKYVMDEIKKTMIQLEKRK